MDFGTVVNIALVLVWVGCCNIIHHKAVMIANFVVAPFIVRKFLIRKSEIPRIVAGVTMCYLDNTAIRPEKAIEAGPANTLNRRWDND